jgi:pyrroline-5-carboxylate reductase
MHVRLVLLGGGNMGAALLGGLLDAKWAPPEELAVVEPIAPRRAELEARFGGVTVLPELTGEADGAVIAVKPGDVAAAARAAAEAGATRVLSIAAGVSTRAIEAALGRPAAVIRAMPNTPALLRAGAAAVAPGAAASDDDVEWAASILRAVGTVVRVPESQLDAVTGLSGSGPAYLFLVAEALTDAGVLAGLSRDVSRALTHQLFAGAAALLNQPDAAPGELRAAVTSPGGTTAAGLRALERAAVRAAFLDAVAAATDRSRELGAG